MRHFTDADVERVLRVEDAEAVLRQAFVALSEGTAAQQARVRTEARGVKLSTLGAVVPQLGVAGAKVYTTIEDKFRFLIALFSSESGQPLATFDANAITRVRTAAVTLLASRATAPERPAAIAIFGTGIQGQAHAEPFARAYPKADLRIMGRATAAAVRRDALRGAGIVITATRSPTPLFEGGWVEDGAFVAAAGSTRSDTRELDDELLRRCARVIVEWREQTLCEAGDLLLAPDAVRMCLDIVELGDILAGKVQGRRSTEEIVIFKSVGVGLEDVSVAGLAYRLLAG